MAKAIPKDILIARTAKQTEGYVNAAGMSATVDARETLRETIGKLADAIKREGTDPAELKQILRDLKLGERMNFTQDIILELGQCLRGSDAGDQLEAILHEELGKAVESKDTWGVRGLKHIIGGIESSGPAISDGMINPYTD